jgi:uncharacterized membrane protein
LGTAEERDGRTALQVLANLAVAVICAVLSAGSAPNAVFLLAASAALAEAAADTVSSEQGPGSAKPRLITTWKKLKVLTGVSWFGTLAGMTAAAVVRCAFSPPCTTQMVGYCNQRRSRRDDRRQLSGAAERRKLPV